MYWQLLDWRLFVFAVGRRSRDFAGLSAPCTAAVILAAVFAAPAVASRPVPALEPVVRGYYAAMDAKDVDGMAALFSGDAVITWGSLRSGFTVLNSPAQIRDFYRSYYLVQGAVHHRVQDLHFDGDTVLVHSAVTWDRMSLRLDLTERMVIRRGQIVALFDAGTCSC